MSREVLINGVWADPDSDWARRNGYDAKTKTFNIDRANKYLDNSVPVTGHLRKGILAYNKKMKKDLKRFYAAKQNPEFVRGPDGIFRMRPDIDAMREWGLQKAGGIRYWDNPKKWDRAFRSLPTTKRNALVAEKQKILDKRHREANPELVRLTQQEARTRSVPTKRFVARKAKTPRRKPVTKKKVSLWTQGRKLRQKKCARGSYRTVKPNKNTLITLCCPPGQWMPRKKKCKKSLQPHLRRTLRKRAR